MQWPNHFTLQMSRSEFQRNYCVSLTFFVSEIKSHRQLEFHVRNYNLKKHKQSLPPGTAQRSWLLASGGWLTAMIQRTVYEKWQMLNENLLGPLEPSFILVRPSPKFSILSIYMETRGRGRGGGQISEPSTYLANLSFPLISLIVPSLNASLRAFNFRISSQEVTSSGGNRTWDWMALCVHVT